jgi:hypothetical protein
VFAACQDANQPTADFQVSDGSAFGGFGNEYFYFLPPLVPSPDYDGDFDPNLLPYLSVQVSGPFTDDTEAVCADPRFVFDEAAGLEVDAANEQYSYGWNTPRSLNRDQVYRICVVLDVPGVEPTTLGFRDVRPTQGGGSVAEDPIYNFNWGSHLAIKFRVELGVLTPALCTSGTLGDDYDCTAQLLGSNETALCDNETCSLTTGVLNEPELWLIEKFGVDNPACFNAADAGDPDSAVAGFPLTMDIPQYAGCVRVTLFDEDLSFDGFVDSYGTVGACFYPESGPPVKVAQGQDESVQMHIEYSDGPIWSLPWGATGGIFAECELVETQSSASGVGGQIASAARKVWRGAQQVLNPWFAPPKVYAFHTGFGGHTSLRSTEDGLTSPDGGSLMQGASLVQDDGALGEIDVQALNMDGTVKVFHLAWALPSQMAATTFCAGPGCSGLATSPLTVNLGDPVTLTIQVTDNGAVADASAFGGRSLGTPRGVEGARVTFADTDGGSDVQYSDDGGYVTYSFTPDGEGLSSITASGFGIGTTGGPYDAFENGTYVNQASLLALGQLTFGVRVCVPTPDADGIIADPAAGFYASQTWQPVEVNLGGSKTGTAYVLMANDCDDLYLAFMVPGDVSNTTSLRFVFDNAPTGSSLGNLSFAESADDDILSMALVNDGLVFQDRYLSDACLGSKQADCGPLDDRQDGTGGASLNGFTFEGTTGWYVYELKHPLKRLPSDVAPFQDFDRDPGQFLGWYLALYLGNGTKANAEFPRQNGNFKSYLGYEIQ